MRADIEVGSNREADRYIGWAPTAVAVRLVGAGEVAGGVEVMLRNRNSRGGQVDFYDTMPGDKHTELTLTLPTSGVLTEVHIGGRFGFPSIADGDAVIDVVTAATGELIGSTSLMVRVRKNADTLTTAERDRFVWALATFNNGGRGLFNDFRNVHTSAGDPEAHGLAGFLPWHRSFLLDLERELQAIDPAVALPYWRFDLPAPKLFSREFIGTSDTTGTVQFAPTNPLQTWATDGMIPGIDRSPDFKTATESAFVSPEATTLALGGPDMEYALFQDMEGDPHGSAHTSFSGSISGIPTAAKDPLFFLLHANVDRLWAKWQWLNDRFDVGDTRTYPYLGASGDLGALRVGHNLKDTMWPWNEDDAPPRPPTAPGGPMAVSLQVSAPGLQPTVGSMIDFQGAMALTTKLGFNYDDVPFEFVGQP